jgi:SAM-dependent methyltransferase
MSFDVVLHLKDRMATFRDVARLLKPGGRFLFTDAAVLVGAISSEQVQARSIHGTTHLSSSDFNPKGLETAGPRLLEAEDRTASLLRSARGRRRARDARRPELVRLEGLEEFALAQRYLDAVITLAEKQSLSRWMYLSERV